MISILKKLLGILLFIPNLCVPVHIPNDYTTLIKINL